MGHSCELFGVTKSSASDTNSKITIFRSRERSFNFCLMDKSPTDRSHQDEAIIALSIRQKCKFTILRSCPSQKVNLYAQRYSHEHKYFEGIELSRIHCQESRRMLRKFDEKIPEDESPMVNWIWWTQIDIIFCATSAWFLLGSSCLGKRTVQILIFSSVN